MPAGGGWLVGGQLRPSFVPLRWGSHVTEALGISPDVGILRVSLSRFNTKNELTELLDVFAEVFGK